jgi:hypothetical protein
LKTSGSGADVSISPEMLANLGLYDNNAAYGIADGGGIPDIQVIDPGKTPPAPTPTPPGGGSPQGQGRAPLIGTTTKREQGGWIVTYGVDENGNLVEVSRDRDRSAMDAVLSMFRNAGLDEGFASELSKIIEGVYASSLAPTESEMLNVIYSSEPYKKRFAGNEAIRKRIADGKGRPGDRLLNPREYMDLESTYRQILQDAGMPTGFWDSPDDFTTLVSEGISPAEMKERVETARMALYDADEFTRQQLKEFYGLSDGELVAYLLDPAKAAPLLEGRTLRSNEYGVNDAQDLRSLYDTASVGGMATRLGLDSDKDLAEDIVKSGQKGKAQDAIGAAASIDKDMSRLGKLYGTKLGYSDVVRENLDLEGGAESGRKRRKLASRERAAFSGAGALNRTSLSRTEDV